MQIHCLFHPSNLPSCADRLKSWKIQRCVCNQGSQKLEDEDLRFVRGCQVKWDYASPRLVAHH